MFSEIASGVHLQPSLLFQTQCVVVADGSGVSCMDPSYFPGEVDAARDLVDHLSTGRVGARRLILTHSDFDHIVGAPAFSDCQVVTHATWDDGNEARAREKVRRFDGEYYIERTHRLDGPIRRDVGIAQEGQALGEFVCYHADGHTADGLVLAHEPSRTLIVGDYLSACEFPFIYVGAERYSATIDKIATLVGVHRPEVLISQHGAPAIGPEAIRMRIDEARYYLDALLSAARAGETADDVAARSAAAWRGSVPDFLFHRHLQNARLALQDVQA